MRPLNSEILTSQHLSFQLLQENLGMAGEAEAGKGYVVSTPIFFLF